MSAADVGSSFASEFLELLTSQQYAALGRMFLAADSSADHVSLLAHVEDNNTIEVYRGADIPHALGRIFEPIARKAVVIETVAANQVSAGVACVVSFTSEAVKGIFTVLLEHCDDETYFVRDITVQLKPIVIADVPAEAPVAVEEAVAVAEEIPAPVATVVETEPAVLSTPPVEVVATPAPAKEGKKGKKSRKETPAAAAPAEEQTEVAAPAEVEEAPVVSKAPESKSPAPEPAVVPVAAAAPSGPKSWASLAKTPGTQASSAPLKVTPPTATPVETPAPAPVTKETKAPTKAAPPVIGDRLMFTIPGLVTDDDIKAALGPLSKSIHSLRNQSDHNRVFVDFTVTNAFDSLKDKQVSVKGFKVNFQRQKPKE